MLAKRMEPSVWVQARGFGGGNSMAHRALTMSGLKQPACETCCVAAQALWGGGLVVSTR